MKPSVLLYAACAGAGAFTLSRPAAALGPVDVEIAARAGGATNPIKGDPINILGFGLGGRAGVSILGIYGGLDAAYYFGGSYQPPASGSQMTLRKTTVTSWMYGVEGGYGFDVLFLTIRPTIEVGNYVIHTSVTGFPDAEVDNIYLEPGVTALLRFGMWFVGADAKVFLTPGLDASQGAFTADGQVGVKF